MGTLFIAGVIGFLLGMLIMWLYGKFAAGQEAIPITAYENTKKELQQLQTDYAVTENSANRLKQDLANANDRMAKLAESQQQATNQLGIMTTVKEHTLARAAELTTDNKELARQLEIRISDIISTNQMVAKLQEEVRSKDEKLKTQLQSFEDTKAALSTEFRVIAGRILDNSSQKLTLQQNEKLNDLLQPFREQIYGFKKDIDTKFTNEATEKGSLKQQIESLVNLNQTIAKEALALTEALRGSTKKQGDWGENILERILEYSGLQKDVHYFVQLQSQNEEGRTIRPDIIVRYPDTRYLVIDAKVSLVHYWDYCNADTVETQKALLPRIVASLKAHIDGLSVKKYTDVKGSPDFIIMFMPVEAAYITAMQHDHTLWQYAYDRKILLISPTNLLPAMKMVSIMWDKDNVNRDGELIVKKAVALYEKFHGFISTFESVGADIDRAQKKWSEAKGQLHTGKDNFITQGSKLKLLLGKRSAKELPLHLVDAATLEDEVGKVE